MVVRLLGPVTWDTDTPSRAVVSVGGQAANVAAWVAALGGQSRLLFARGTDLRPSWLDGCSWLHLPAYSLVSHPIAGAALAAAAAARAARLSIDLSSTAVLTEFGVARFIRLLGDLSPDVVLGTEAEMALVKDLRGPDLVVKLGAAGVRAGGRHYPAAATDAVDSTGAGDAFAAGYLLGGVAAGLAAAARAVATMGGMP